MSTMRKLLRKLNQDKAAVAMTEFAMATPLLMTVGLYGIETTNLAMTHMRISQVTIQIADNASRIGDTTTLQNRKIYENDINDLLVGADVHAGQATDLFEHGRVIISSLETVPGETPTRQYIHWQRCKGKQNVNSSYGFEGDGEVGKPAITGMGPSGSQVRAPSGGAVMFVEVSYEYQPIITDALISDNTITSYSAFIVRDDRDLTDIYQRDAINPDPVSDCATFDSFKAIP